MFYPQLSELCIILIILVIWLFNRRIITSKTKTFGFVLGAAIYNALTDFIVRYFYYTYDPNNKIYELFIRSYIFSYTLIVIAVYVYFRYGLINLKKYRISKVLTCFISTVNAILILYLPLNAIVEGDSIHFIGMAVNYSYYYVAFMLALSFIFIYSNKEYIERLDKIGAYITIIFFLLGGSIRYFNAHIEVTGFLFAVGIFFLYIIIENPENYRDSETELFFYNVFYDYIYEKMLDKEKTSIAYIYLKNNIGEDKQIIFDEIFKQTIKDFKISKNSHVFRNNINELIFVSNELDKINNLVESYTNLINSQESYLRILGHSVSTVLIIPDTNLVKDADEFLNIFQLMNAKNNQYKNYLSIDYYDSETAYKIQSESSILKEIDDVIAKQKIDLQFSFIFDNDNNECGIEISSKILKQNGGILNPSQYVPVAIKYSKIAEIDDLIFENVSSLIHDSIFSDRIKHILIKTSIMRFEDITYADKLQHIIDKYAINPSIICLELTNTETINNKEAVINTMKKINSSGMKLILGGFGKNESNLNYLIDLPVYGIKFHGTILSSLFKNEQAKMILNNVINVAHSIGMKTIMTGIVNQADYDLAKNIGNDMLEGEYLSKKVNVSETKKAFSFVEI